MADLAIDLDNDDENEEMLLVHYAHYGCSVDPIVTWDDEYESACDSECPACGQDIEAVSWHALTEKCTDECDTELRRPVAA
jgi:hypothetical protein